MRDNHPEPVAQEIKKNSLDHIGGMVDHLFLTLPKILKPALPIRKIDIAKYEQEIDYYYNKGVMENPAALFQLTSDLPDYRLISSHSFHEGYRDLYAFNSGFTPLNPLVRERYGRHGANQEAFFVRWRHGEKPRKTVICLHGYLLGEPGQAERMFSIAKLFDKGLDVVLFVSPFHWRRAPRNRLQRGIFLQPDDVVFTAEAVSQTMTDLNTTLTVLFHLGVTAAGLVGASMGGYNASLFSCLSDRIAFAAMIVPAVDYSKPFGPRSVKYPFPVSERLMEKMTSLWRLHSPLNFHPKIDKKALIFIASKGDKLCPSEHIREIIEKWDGPRAHFLTGGHWLIFNNRKRGRLWYSFLEEMGFLDSDIVPR